MLNLKTYLLWIYQLKEFFKNSDVLVGISDYNTLIVTALRSQKVKGNVKTTLYRDYNSFDIKRFQNLKSNNTKNVSDFQNTFITSYYSYLYKHAPIKRKNPQI